MDAETYLFNRICAIDQEIMQVKQRNGARNLGLAFISFKEKDCVVETMDEIELVKQKLVKDTKI